MLLRWKLTHSNVCGKSWVSHGSPAKFLRIKVPSLVVNSTLLHIFTLARNSIMGVARIWNRLFKPCHVTREVLQGSQFVLHHIRQEQEMTIHNPEYQLHHRQDPNDIAAGLRHRWLLLCSAKKVNDLALHRWWMFSWLSTFLLQYWVNYINFKFVLNSLKTEL